MVIPASPFTMNLSTCTRTSISATPHPANIQSPLLWSSTASISEGTSWFTLYTSPDSLLPEATLPPVLLPNESHVLQLNGPSSPSPYPTIPIIAALLLPTFLLCLIQMHPESRISYPLLRFHQPLISTSYPTVLNSLPIHAFIPLPHYPQSFFFFLQQKLLQYI